MSGSQVAFDQVALDQVAFDQAVFDLKALSCGKVSRVSLDHQKALRLSPSWYRHPAGRGPVTKYYGSTDTTYRGDALIFRLKYPGITLPTLRDSRNEDSGGRRSRPDPRCTARRPQRIEGRGRRAGGVRLPPGDVAHRRERR